MINFPHKEVIIRSLSEHLSDKELLKYLTYFKRGYESEGHLIGSFTAEPVVPTKDGEAIRDQSKSIEDLMQERIEQYLRTKNPIT